MIRQPEWNCKGDTVSTRTDRNFLKVQLLETQRLQQLTVGHPLMSHALSVRQQELNEQVQALPLGKKESRTVLFFSGDPVTGSLGIDAMFASRVLEPFQKMVQADYTNRWVNGGGLGRRLGEANSRLMLTGLPRGSFGLELIRSINDDLFADDEVADTLAHVTRLVDSSARSDEDFAAALDEAAPRVVQNLKQFLEVISKGRAGLRLESGDLRCTISADQACLAFNRVSETQTDEETEQFVGTFTGVLLDSWMFNFSTDAGERIAGKIDQSLTEEDLVEFDRKFFKHRCIATVVTTKVVFKNGRQRVSYQLAKLEPIVDSLNLGSSDAEKYTS